MMDINFSTINCDEKRINWEFNSIEEILREWWTDDGYDLPDADDEVVKDSFYVNGKMINVRKFEEIIIELSIIYWSEN